MGRLLGEADWVARTGTLDGPLGEAVSMAGVGEMFSLLGEAELLL